MTFQIYVACIFLLVEINRIETQNLLPNSSCRTPNQESARCISLYQCQVILDALRNASSGAIDFAKQSQCGYSDGFPLVCCGTTGYFALPPDIINLFAKPTEAAAITPSTSEETVILEDFKVSELPGRSVCGLQREEDRIIGGVRTRIYDFPWMAALEFVTKASGSPAGIKCGGSLINNVYVLTAAHCLNHAEFTVKRVWLGDWVISTDPDCVPSNETLNEVCNDPVQKIDVAEEIPHAYHDPSNGNNDVALLRLARNVTYTSFIRPVCLPPINLPDPGINTRMVAVGWGATNRQLTATSDIKLKVDLPLQPISRCVEAFESDRVSTNQLCAGGELGKDSCQGDSGGPLMREYENSRRKQWYLEGIVSRGAGCGTLDPALYTRVSRYIRWIINNISAS